MPEGKPLPVQLPPRRSAVAALHLCSREPGDKTPLAMAKRTVETRLRICSAPIIAKSHIW